MEQIDFINMKDGTREEYQFLDRLWSEHNDGGHAENILTLLKTMQGPKLGYKIDRYDHSLQSATRALRDGRDSEYVVAALLHDVGDAIAPENHSQAAAAILRPYISDKTWWIIQHHGIFQGYYFWHHIGGDRDARERFRDHPWFADCAEFCELYDQNCFDPDYENEPLETFLPMVKEVFSRQPWSRAKNEEL